ncbi:HIT family protein [Pseudazoarcus pumilus]|uniref:HIT family protein n=1 Tax=Pseudazoarcus pumilus TaxID=2067960 RepID=A0A2I6SAA3_9RHOO|nr:HIT family protein [Pseudazoarcus pumilus]AUN96182.1 HIT family protein [Pseudazoarcus pumilus]
MDTRDATHCPLCDPRGDRIVWQDARCRVILVLEPDYPGYCRVVWKDHIVEMSDLSAADRRHLMDVVFATEAALRELMTPDKINLASLGNLVPHLHWHVIPRHRDDRHYPQPIWGTPERTPTLRAEPDERALGEAIVRHLS